MTSKKVDDEQQEAKILYVARAMLSGKISRTGGSREENKTKLRRKDRGERLASSVMSLGRKQFRKYCGRGGEKMAPPIRCEFSRCSDHCSRRQQR
jgi:hypothetical protein